MAEKKRQNLKEFFGFLYALFLVLVVHVFLFQPFTIPSGSMIPTLLVGDYIFVSKFSYAYSKYSIFFAPNFIKGRIGISSPKRGDIAVFYHDFKTEEEKERHKLGGIIEKISEIFGINMDGACYVKRVIGLPKDKIQMKSGMLYINEEMVKLEKKDKYLLEDQSGEKVVHDLYEETLPNGKKHPIIKHFAFGEAHLDNTKEFKLKSGEYFMMGDNRDNSCDSRDETVGIIPKEKLIGKAQLIFFSKEKSGFDFWNWPFFIRYSRIIKLVK